MEEDTFVSTYRECVYPLYAYVSRRCGSDRGLAEDVTQEAWLRAARSWRKSGLPNNPLAWLKTVARNLLINYFRRAPHISLAALPKDWEQKVLGNGADSHGLDHSAAVSWGLARLRPGQAHLLEAYHLDGRRVAEIAAELGLSERAVEGRLRRARIKLRKKLEPLVGAGGGES
jgi:RNA polymerase sigma-70 factor (ECF subfamily)